MHTGDTLNENLQSDVAVAGLSPQHSFTVASLLCFKSGEL